MENGQNKDKLIMTEQEAQGVKELKDMMQEFLGSGDGSKSVREYLTNASDDDILLLRFLKGRKYRPKHAWETIKRYAEIRFDTYPEAFSFSFLKETKPMIDNHVFGVLKNRDSKGILIAYFNASEWDTDKYPLDKLLAVTVFIVERMLQHEDGINNGVVYIQECSGMGMKHVKQYTLNEMLKYLNVFWYAFPLKLKRVYYINIPYLVSFLYGIIKPFFPKKLKERFLFTSTGKRFEPLHERISPDILPKCLGGMLENHEALDPDFLRFD